MKSFNILLLFVIAVSFGYSCNGQAQKLDNVTISGANTVKVYYFHNARRCTTCKAVEAESKKSVQELYGDKVVFEVYDLETKAGKLKAKELGVSGQTLLIVSGETKINITNEGFLYARKNPDKLKQIIKEKIDPLFK